MAIFSRRTIQRMLNENAEFLTAKQLGQHVSRLNKEDFQSLETEWEVAVLNAFSKMGEVQHEPDFEGTGKLDLLFIPNRDTKTRLVADITTVSDEGFENENPLKAFDIELKHRLDKAGLRVNSFGYSIKAHPLVKYGHKTKLMLPPRGEFGQEIFNRKFKAFLNHIKQNLDKTYRYQISTTKTNILITYSPHQEFFTASYPIYTQATSKTQNPIYNTLKLKAQKQFKKISYTGSKGIILCDGGSDMVHSQLSGGFHFISVVPDTVKEFLRQNQSIEFVLMLSSIWKDKGRIGFYPGRSVRAIQVEIFPNKNFGKLPVGIRDSLSELQRHFSEPINTPSGARETIRHGFDPKRFRPLQGGFAVRSKEIRISASDVLALLAGVVTQEKLFKSLKFKPWDNDPSSIRNPFEYFLSQKMRIVDIQVEDTPYDDSTLIFKFDGPDPAISKFINPNAK